MSDFENFVVQEIEEHLAEMADCGRKVYGCDLGSTLFENENIDGYWHPYADAGEFIKKYWDEAREYFQYMKRSQGETNINPFDDPEGYQVCMITEKASIILAECDILQENWDNNFEINPVTAAIICDDMGLDTGLSQDVLEGFRKNYADMTFEQAAQLCNEAKGQENLQAQAQDPTADTAEKTAGFEARLDAAEATAQAESSQAQEPTKQQVAER